MDKIADLFKNNKKVVAIGAAAASLALGALYFLNKKEEVCEEGEKESDDEREQGSDYIKKAKQIASKINVRNQGNPRNYDLQTISQVFEQSIELAEDEYIKVTLDNRKERRAMMENDIQGYEKLIMDYNDEIENIIKKAQQTILDILGINFEDFEESVIAFMEKGHYQEIYMFQAAIRQKIKEKVKSTKDLTVDEVKEIIRFQNEMLQQQPELLKKILQKLSASNETAQLIPIIISNLINDYIYNQYGVEEEDQMKVMTRQEIISDPEIMILLQEVEQSMFSLIVSFNPNMEGMEGAF